MLFRWRGCEGTLRILGVSSPSAQRGHEKSKNKECENPQSQAAGFQSQMFGKPLHIDLDALNRSVAA
jgi:hypothetical protein